ncbi:MAG: tetratricopeptide repeat protein, partial [Clostridia bacterium]|nr:tetratricopeptide repeat protein [Clostridia bacterium]
FGRTDEALDLYRKTREIYEKYLGPCDYRLGSLYNNMGLALFAKKDYAAALALYEKALEIMKILPDCEGEQAVTHLNIADLLYATEGAEESEKAVSFRLDEAEKAFDGATLRNGKYAFICTKCAPVFGFYGRFLFEAELKKRAKDIYERN